jgi:hypothetical protein
MPARRIHSGEHADLVQLVRTTAAEELAPLAPGRRRTRRSPARCSGRPARSAFSGCPPEQVGGSGLFDGTDQIQFLVICRHLDRESRRAFDAIEGGQ